MGFKVFAKLDNDNTVITAITVDDTVSNTEQGCIEWLTKSYGWQKWKETFPDKSLRLNYATTSKFKWDENLDAFVERIAPYPSWTLNLSTGLYDPPTPRPVTYSDPPENLAPDRYRWDEATLTWIKY